jgi:hypothetical protein
MRIDGLRGEDLDRYEESELALTHPLFIWNQPDQSKHWVSGF